MVRDIPRGSRYGNADFWRLERSGWGMFASLLARHPECELITERIADRHLARTPRLILHTRPRILVFFRQQRLLIRIDIIARYSHVRSRRAVSKMFRKMNDHRVF